MRLVLRVMGIVVLLALGATVFGFLFFNPQSAIRNPQSADAQTSDEAFEQFKREQEQSFQEYSEQTTREYEAFVKAEREAFEQFKAEVERKWREFVGSTKKDWVEYRRGLNARSQVDFERGTAKVEVLVEAGEKKEVSARLQEAVVDLITDRGTSSDYSVPLPDGTVDTPRPLGDKPVLAGQVVTRDGKPVTKANAAAFAKEVVDASRVKNQKIVGEDGKKRVKLTVTFSLVPDHLRRRADRYVSLVKRYAQRFNLDPPLVFATIHTESYYNPKARSSAPAYGLMQLVPTSGGRAAYRYVYKKDRVLPPSYFYVPEQNIELGCAYLNFLRRKVFRGVQDDRKALYCIVAAYNTGAGNVSRAITGSRKVRKAIPLIDGMPAKDLYARLRKDLPYEETRDYLKRVTERMTLYGEWR